MAKTHICETLQVASRNCVRILLDLDLLDHGNIPILNGPKTFFLQSNLIGLDNI